MSLLLEVTRAQTRAAREAVEQFKAPLTAESAEDLTGLISDLLGYPARMRRLNNLIFAQLRYPEHRQLGWLNDARSSLMQRFEESRALLDQVRKLAESTATHGGHVPNLNRLSAAIAELDSLRDEIFSRWGIFEPNALEGARLAHERGETIPLDELIDELQNRLKA